MTETKETQLKPFLRWAGGKSRLLPEIRKRYPKGLGEEVNKYADLFVGGGAVFFDILSRFDLEKFYISDKNEGLIGLYRTLIEKEEAVIEVAKAYFSHYAIHDEEERKVYYNNCRDAYNLLKKLWRCIDSPECAALFLFLNANCFNGIYRENNGGECNSTWGTSHELKEDRIRAFCASVFSHARGIDLWEGEYDDFSLLKYDYSEASRYFVFIDPPYVPRTQSQIKYTQDGFSQKDSIDVALYARRLAEDGCKVMCTNSDGQDGLMENLYKRLGFYVSKVQRRECVGEKKESRGVVNEIIATSYNDYAE